MSDHTSSFVRFETMDSRIALIDAGKVEAILVGLDKSIQIKLVSGLSLAVKGGLDEVREAVSAARDGNRIDR